MKIEWYHVLLCLAVPMNYFYWIVLHRFLMKGLTQDRLGQE